MCLSEINGRPVKFSHASGTGLFFAVRFKVLLHILSEVFDCRKGAAIPAPLVDVYGEGDFDFHGGGRLGVRRLPEFQPASRSGRRLLRFL